jgi:hypothetical protein
MTPRLVVDVLGSATFLSSELSLWSGILFALCKNAQQKILLRFASNFDHPFLVNLLMVTACRSQEGAELLKSFKVREKLAWKGFRHKCETRLKVVPLSFCLLKKVSQTKGSAFSRLPFILRFHDLAFLHFRRFGQVGYLVTVQTWQRTKSWRASCHFAIFPSLVNFDFHFILSLAVVCVSFSFTSFQPS